MFRRIAVLALLATAISSYVNGAPEKSGRDAAQPQTEAEKLCNQLEALRDAALTDDYAYHELAHLTENIGPRGLGSPQAEAATEFVAAEMRKLGLDAKLEAVHVPKWDRGIETAELVEYPGQAPGSTQKIVLTALGGNTPTPNEGIAADVVVVRNYNELARLGQNHVSGKIVLFHVVYDKQKALANYTPEAYGEVAQYRQEGAQKAAALGAVACLVRSAGSADFRLPHTGSSAPAGIPAGAVSSEDADLIDHLSKQGRVRMHLTMTAHFGAEVVTHNVIADLEGSDHPEQVVVVSGHLDSWDLGTGAIDDGAGVAVAMESVQLLNQLGLRPRRTVRVIAWMDEESFGSGHAAYAKDYKAEFANHAAAVESDLGASHPFGVYAKVKPAELKLLDPVQDALESFGANIMRRVDGNPGSDLGPLADAGVPTFAPIQDGRTYFDYHHSAADTLDKVIPQQLRENAAVVAVLTYFLAEMPQPFSRD
jgi:hypothetical protein